MTPTLGAVINEAYRVFGDYTIGDALVVCHCNCCMTEETQRELIATPLRQISASLLAEYTNCAHGWDDAQIAREMRYFLPRYFELIALHDPPDRWGSTSACAGSGTRNGASCGRRWRRRSSSGSSTLFSSRCWRGLILPTGPAGWGLDFDFTDVLTLAVTAGGDVDRLLTRWNAADDPPAPIHMAALRRRVIREVDRTYLHSPYLEDHPEAADKIGAFLMRPEVDARIEGAFFTVEDPRLQKILSDALQK
jgi:hypothetical protein